MHSASSRPPGLTRLVAFLILFLFAAAHRAAAADSITLVWDDHPHPQVRGYFVYVGQVPGAHTKTIDAGSATSYVFADAQPGQQYCFAVAVYTLSEVVSQKSREVCGFSDEPPRLTNPGDQVTAPGATVALDLKGSDPEGKPITYTATGLPPGLTLGRATGGIAGSPTVVGTYSVTITASDGLLSSAQSFTWTVGEGGPIPPPPPTGSDAIVPSSGAGESQVFTLRYSRPAGASDLQTVWVWFRSTSAVALANSCVARYDRTTETFLLLGDDGTRWQAATIAVTSQHKDKDPKDKDPKDKDLKNNNCSIAVKSASAIVDGPALTLSLPMTFAPAFGGPKNVDMYSTTGGGSVSGWRTRGTWSVPGGISVALAGLESAEDSGPRGHRVAVHSSSAGEGTDLTTVSIWFRVGETPSKARSCVVRYDLRTRRVALLNDKGSSWTEARLGSSENMLENRQCAIPLDQSSVVVQTSDTLNLNLTVRFSSIFGEPKDIYLDATSSSGTSSGWTTRRGWAVK